MFDIAIERRGGRATGVITIGAAQEIFDPDLSLWNVEDYAQSWLRAAAHVLERGYGRFLVSVCAPGTSPYVCWVCRTRAGEARLFKSILLGSLTGDFATPRDGETLEDDYAERNDERPTLKVLRCSLADIAAFEARLRGGAAN
ncbi:MAG: hypothetical protein R3C25_06520 [Hyphomonadaceae bacterium]